MTGYENTFSLNWGSRVIGGFRCPEELGVSVVEAGHDSDVGLTNFETETK